MSTSQQSPASCLRPLGDADSPLPTLLRELLEMRDTFFRTRRVAGGQAAATDAARGDMLRALETYIRALAKRRLPVPYALRDELRLLQSITPRR